VEDAAGADVSGVYDAVGSAAGRGGWLATKLDGPVSEWPHFGAELDGTLDA
jgi:hypothetical protein